MGQERKGACRFRQRHASGFITAATAPKPGQRRLVPATCKTAPCSAQRLKANAIACVAASSSEQQPAAVQLASLPALPAIAASLCHRARPARLARLARLPVAVAVR